MKPRVAFLFLVVVGSTAPAAAAVRLPFLFTHHMVLQRDLPAPVYGKASPGEEVTVRFGDQEQTTVADEQGTWRVDLDPLAASNEPRELVVTGSQSAAPLTVRDVLVGDVWVCSGQSNMQWALANTKDGDLDRLAANRPLLRLLNVNQLGSQTPRKDIDRPWQRCTPKTAAAFSAVGYYYGVQLQESLGVPIGLIRNAWGGSACEAWAPLDRLAGNPAFTPYLEGWNAKAADVDEPALREAYEERLADYYEARNVAYAAGEELPDLPWLDSKLFHQHRPANLFNARVLPLTPFAIKGVIWYQGETNAGRAHTYRELMGLTVRAWRDAWGQGDFPFYWVQLADFQAEATEAVERSSWALLREAQTEASLEVRNAGQAVILDLGEANDIHPRNKRDVAARLARLALSDTYGKRVKGRSPRLDAISIAGRDLLVSFVDVGQGLKTFDGVSPRGFAIAGADRVFHAAEAEIVAEDTIRLRSPEVAKPVAARYGWAQNPVVNVYDSAWLPLTPFRTDDWLDP